MDERSSVIARRCFWAAAGLGASALVFWAASAVSLGKYSRPLEAVGKLALVVGFVVGCFLVFNVLIWISMRLRGRARVSFNVVGAIAVPSCLSAFSVEGGIERTARAVLSDTPSVWFLVPLLAVVAVVSFLARDIDHEHPIGGLALISLLSWVFYVGLFYGLWILISLDDSGKLAPALKTLRIDLLRQYTLLVCLAYLTVWACRWFEDVRAKDKVSSE